MIQAIEGNAVALHTLDLDINFLPEKHLDFFCRSLFYCKTFRKVRDLIACDPKNPIDRTKIYRADRGMVEERTIAKVRGALKNTPY